MFEATLHHGAGELRLSAPRTLVAGRYGLERDADGVSGDSGAAVWSTALRELAGSGFPAGAAAKRVGLLLADGTRAWEPEDVLPRLAGLLAGAGCVDAFLCTGTHAPDTPENRALAARVRATLEGLPVPTSLHVHDARSDEHRSFGTTRRGTPVEVLARADACEAFLVVADMKVHYFAGYSNPTKYAVPGLATLASARANHSLALEESAVCGRHPWHPDAARRDNPLAEDLVEAFERFVGARPHHALCLVSSGAEVRWAGGGPTREVASRALLEVDASASVSVPPVRFLVVSAGGAPHDESLYTVQRALELAQPAVLDGGEVLFLAACPNGVGPPAARENFVMPLTRPLDEVVATRREDYVLYGHKPVKLARILRRLARVHVHSELPDELVASIHMHPAPDPQAVVDEWVRRAEPEDRIAFLDDASKLFVLPDGVSSRSSA